jgi:P2-related tail formation protein
MTVIKDSILASALQGSDDLKAWDIMVRDRYNGLDLTPILIYMIDTVPAAALPHLARQFDVLGVKGWKYATTETKQRELLKQAIELHRYKGTPWSIKEALGRIGFPGAEIIEGIGQYYDGSFAHNGLVTYNGVGNWACFKVIFDLGNDNGINATQSAELIEIVNEYKNVRSRLVDIDFVKNISDQVTMSDEFTLDRIVGTVVFDNIEDQVTMTDDVTLERIDGTLIFNNIEDQVTMTDEVTGV